MRRLALWRHVFHGTGALLRGSRLRGLREVIDVKLADLPNLLHGAPRPLERLEIADARHPDPNSDAIRDHEQELPDKLPELTHLRVAAVGGVLDGVRGMVERLPKLRELAVGLTAPSLAELAAFANERGITVQALGRVDVAFIPESATVDISFPGALRADLGAAVAKLLATAGDAPIRRVVIRKPDRAETEGAGDAPPILRRRKESLDLRSIYDAANARGAPCSVEEEEPFWGRRAE